MGQCDRLQATASRRDGAGVTPRGRDRLFKMRDGGINVATPSQSELAGDSEKREKAVKKKFGTFSESFSTFSFLRNQEFLKGESK